MQFPRNVIAVRTLIDRALSKASGPLWRDLDLAMIQRCACLPRRWMIQPVRGLAAYRAGNAIERIKRVRDDRHDTLHKVAAAQTPGSVRAFINPGRTQRQRALPGNVTR